MKNQAQALAQAGRLDEAEAAYENYLRLRPGDSGARLELGRLYGCGKQYIKALAEYDRVLATQPDYAPALTGKARIISWQGKYLEGLSLYNRVLEFEPDNGDAATGRAFTLLWMGRAEEARQEFGDLDQRFPGDLDVEQGLKQAEAAIAEIQRPTPSPEQFLAAADCLQIDALVQAGLPEHGRDQSWNLGAARALATCKEYAKAVLLFRENFAAAPADPKALADFGDALLKVGGTAEAIPVLRMAVYTDPASPAARIGLARALAWVQQYGEALAVYDDALHLAPGNYDALQGQAFVLLWTGRRGEAQAIFHDLQARQPTDSANESALKEIARQDDAAYWGSQKPLPGAPPAAFGNYYKKFVDAHPQDTAARNCLASWQMKTLDWPGAEREYRQVLALSPGNHEARIGVARALAMQNRYEESEHVLNSLLQENSDDAEAMESLAQDHAWQSHFIDAEGLFRKLTIQHPLSLQYRLELASVQIRHKEFRAATANLWRVLKRAPRNREARNQLALAALGQGHYLEANQWFDAVLRTDPLNYAARLGKARVAYFRGSFELAHRQAERLRDERPDDFDTLFLLANIANAQRERHNALRLLQHAGAVMPGDPDVQEMEKQVEDQSHQTFSTTVSYAREIGSPTPQGQLVGTGDEDLRLFGYGSTWRFSFLPRTDSSLSVNYLPVSTETGLSGEGSPSQFLYCQSTRLNRWTLRAGVGMVRFGPGDSTIIPSQTSPITSATNRVLALAGASYAKSARTTLSFDYTQSAIPYTPTSVRMGVREKRATARIDYRFGPRDTAYAAAWFAQYTSEAYLHLTYKHGLLLTKSFVADRDDARGGEWAFIHLVHKSRALSAEGGYRGLGYGFSSHHRGIYMGYFNPGFYQQHQMTARLYGQPRRRWSYDLQAGWGIQQVEEGQAFTRALLVKPQITYALSPRLRVGLSFTHYNSAQSLGLVRGNAMDLTTDWSF
jgi:tetratricopeptide (TPR) repeat protein